LCPFDAFQSTNVRHDEIRVATYCNVATRTQLCWSNIMRHDSVLIVRVTDSVIHISSFRSASSRATAFPRVVSFTLVASTTLVDLTIGLNKLVTTLLLLVSSFTLDRVAKAIGCLSVTYCFDVSCEAVPADEGSINWVLKAANNRCEIEVTPNCGISSGLCHPSCPAGNDEGGSSNGGGNGSVPPEATTPTSQTKTVPSAETASKNIPAIAGSVVAVAAVVAAAGVVYRVVSKKNAAAAGH